jgi:hypothetical protein
LLTTWAELHLPGGHEHNPYLVFEEARTGLWHC